MENKTNLLVYIPSFIKKILPKEGLIQKIAKAIKKKKAH